MNEEEFEMFVKYENDIRKEFKQKELEWELRDEESIDEAADRDLSGLKKKKMIGGA